MHSRGHDEDALLDRLRQALTPAPRRPSRAELLVFMRAVAQGRRGDAPPVVLPDPTAPCRRIVELPPMILWPASAPTGPGRVNGSRRVRSPR